MFSCIFYSRQGPYGSDPTHLGQTQAIRRNLVPGESSRILRRRKKSTNKLPSITLPKVDDFLEVVTRKTTLPKLIEIWDILDDEEEDVIDEEVSDDLPEPKKKRQDRHDDDPGAGAASMSFSSRFVT